MKSIKNDIIRKSNTLCHNYLQLEHAIKVSKKTLKNIGQIKLDAYTGDNAVVVLSPKDMLNLCTNDFFALPVEVDEFLTSIPSIAQRKPNKKRIQNQIEAWNNDDIYPDSKLEHIRIHASGVRVKRIKSKYYLIFSEESLFEPIDGAGRIASAEYLLSQLKSLSEPNVLTNKKIAFLLSIGLFSDPNARAREFLLYNRYNKKTSKGTNLCVGSSVNGEIIPITCKDSSFTTYVLKTLYKNNDFNGTLLSEMPWDYEGNQCQAEIHKNSCSKASVLDTVLGRNPIVPEFEALRKAERITIEDIPNWLDFIFRQWYIMTPKARTNNVNKRRFLSGLGLQIMITISLRVINKHGFDAQKFRSACNDIVNQTFESRKDLFMDQKKKKMDCDLMWFHLISIAGPNFNSGAVACKNAIHAFLSTAKLMGYLKPEVLKNKSN